MITGEVRRGRVAPADRAHLRAGWPGWSTREESACNAAAARGDKRKGFTEADYARAARCRTPAARGPLVVVWDNLNTHVSGAMGERVSARDWLRVYQLPPYAHELNPVDGVREGWAALGSHHAGRRLGGGQVGGVRAELGPEGAFQDFVQHPQAAGVDADGGGFADVARRHAQVHLLALLADTDKATVNPLDLDQWVF